MDDWRRDLTLIKRESLDNRNAIVRMENQLRSTIGELKRVAQVHEQLRSSYRYFTVASMVLLSTVLIAAGVVLSEVRAGFLEDKITVLEEKIALDAEQIRDLELLIEKRDSADLKAMQILKLIQEERNALAVKEFEKLDQAETSRSSYKLLTLKIEELKRKLAEEHFKEGLRHFKIGGMKSAVQEFDISLKYYANPEYLPKLYYHRGQAYHALKDYARAESDLLAITRMEPRPREANHAQLLVGLAMEEGGDMKRALEHYKKVADEEIHNPWRSTFRYRVRLLTAALEKERKKAQTPAVTP